MRRYGALPTMAAAALMLGPAPAAAQVDHDAQAWLALKASGTLSGPVVASVEVLVRDSDDQNGIYESQLTGLLGYKASGHLTLWAGYTRSIGYRPTASIENRIRQQAIFAWPGVAGGTLSARSQLEQRFFQGAANAGWRFREQLRYGHPLQRGGKTDLVVSHESYFALNTSTGQREGYQRMRNFVGLNTPLAPHVKAEIGYLNQYELRYHAPDRMVHAASFTFNYGF